ncbi:hypothetical protein [Shinella sp.]|uniref:hypothetical protein n=1 Tax=Shinella sp. TaxID=1870904 RepID=UPI004037434F
MSDETPDDEKPNIDLGPLPDLPRKKGRRKRVVPEHERMKKGSPEWDEHMRRIGRKKGDPKVPGSGRKATPKETKEWLSGKSLDVAKLLYDIAFDDTVAAKDRIKAAMWVAEMSIAKAPTQSEVKVSHSHTIADMLAEINSMRLTDNSKTIDLTAKSVEDAVFVPVPGEDK